MMIKKIKWGDENEKWPSDVRNILGNLEKLSLFSSFIASYKMNCHLQHLKYLQARNFNGNIGVKKEIQTEIYKFQEWFI